MTPHALKTQLDRKLTLDYLSNSTPARLKRHLVGGVQSINLDAKLKNLLSRHE